MIRKLLDKLNNKHFLSLAGNAVVSLLGLLTWSLLYKSLPTIADAGKYVFFYSVLSLCEAIRGGFLQTATIRFYAGTEEGRGREMIGSIWFLGILVTACVLLLNLMGYYLLPFTNNAELPIVVKWVGVTFLSTLPFNIVYWKLQADEQYGKLLRLKSINTGSTLIAFATLALTKRMTLESVLLYNMVTSAFASFMALVWNQSGIRAVRHRSRAAIMEVVHYGKYSMATTLSASLLGNIDNLIINFLLGPAAVAIYSIPMKLMQIVEIPLQSFVGTGMSGMAVAFNQNNMHQVTYILKKYAGMLTMAFIPLSILAFFFADIATYVVVLGRHEYVGGPGHLAANIFRLYMLFALLYPVERFNGATLDMINRPKVNFYKVLIMLVVNTICDFAGIAVFHSLYGIAAAALLTHLSGVLFGYYRLNQYIKVSVPSILHMGFVEMKLFVNKQLKRG